VIFFFGSVSSQPLYPIAEFCQHFQLVPLVSSLHKCGELGDRQKWKCEARRSFCIRLVLTEMKYTKPLSIKPPKLRNTQCGIDRFPLQRNFLQKSHIQLPGNILQENVLKRC